LGLVGAVAIGLEVTLGLTPGAVIPDGGEVDGASLAVLGVTAPVGAIPVPGPPLLLGGSCVPPMPGSVFWLAGAVPCCAGAMVPCGAAVVALALISVGLPGGAVGLAT
jgi:hypothetical protein